MKKTFSITTDPEGNYKKAESAPVPFIPIQNVDIKARLLNGAGMRVDGTIDIDAEDGSPSNEAKSFTLIGEGDWCYVGKFKVNFGGEKFNLELSGMTTPPSPSVELSIEIEAW